MFRPTAFAIPPAPLAITMAGLMPFFAAALAIWVFAGDPARQAGAELALLAYAAVILSFLGGARWGVEIDSASFEPPRWGALSLSVLGSLVGWVVILIAVLGGLFPWLFLFMAAALALQWLWDMLSRRALPAWYEGLRALATAGAVSSLVFAWVVTAWPVLPTLG
ncbi:MAG: DUF3429 domain-containing protein [Pseudomonadota bacterium]